MTTLFPSVKPLLQIPLTMAGFLAGLILTGETVRLMASPASLRTPGGLESSVRFWERVFSHPARDCLIHDRKEPQSVFTVALLPDNPRKQKKVIKKKLRRLRRGLKQLARRRQPGSALQKEIHSGTPAHLRTPAYWRKAGKRLRCQRGVDLVKGLEKGRQYLPMIHRVLKRYRIPPDLAWLPLLESGFNRFARSHAGARGLWQLMPSVARSYGLKVNRRLDERTNPYKSTVVAARLLRKLKHRHKTWPLAVTAYNYGSNGMKRAIRKFGADYMRIRRRHSTSIFGFAVKNYYPAFLAARNVISKHTGSLRSAPLLSYKVRRGDSLTRIARRHSTTVAALKKVNRLRSGRIMAGSRLKIPRTPASIRTYRIKKGDTLIRIARRFDMNLSELRQKNGLPRGRDRIFPGQKLDISRVRF